MTEKRTKCICSNKTTPQQIALARVHLQCKVLVFLRCYLLHLPTPPLRRHYLSPSPLVLADIEGRSCPQDVRGDSQEVAEQPDARPQTQAEQG